ncbi:MAG TPA: HAD family hydrolase [Bacteroides sp.]|nr:HAD family hydrolase [Bacteroides sp.]
MEVRKAIFLDRDGVLCDNSKHYYITTPEAFTLNPGVIEALSVFRDRGYMLIVITNQGGISTGRNTMENVERVHRHMRELLQREGITLDEIYYCPHHADNENCLCRKPLPLMLEKAMARFGIDPEASYFIGDSERDMEAGEAAGIPSIRVPSNGNLTEVLEQIG